MFPNKLMETLFPFLLKVAIRLTLSLVLEEEVA